MGIYEADRRVVDKRTDGSNRGIVPEVPRAGLSAGTSGSQGIPSEESQAQDGLLREPYSRSPRDFLQAEANFSTAVFAPARVVYHLVAAQWFAFPNEATRMAKSRQDRVPGLLASSTLFRMKPAVRRLSMGSGRGSDGEGSQVAGAAAIEKIDLPAAELSVASTNEASESAFPLQAL